MKELKLVKLVVEAEIPYGYGEESEIEKDLLGELVKVKSGVYDNVFYGTITEIKLA